MAGDILETKLESSKEITDKLTEQEKKLFTPIKDAIMADFNKDGDVDSDNDKIADGDQAGMKLVTDLHNLVTDKDLTRKQLKTKLAAMVDGLSKENITRRGLKTSLSSVITALGKLSVSIGTGDDQTEYTLQSIIKDPSLLESPEEVEAEAEEVEAKAEEVEAATEGETAELLKQAAAAAEAVDNAPTITVPTETAIAGADGKFGRGASPDDVVNVGNELLARTGDDALSQEKIKQFNEDMNVLTRQGVIAFQERIGVTADGGFGKNTLNAFKDRYGLTVTIEKKAIDWDAVNKAKVDQLTTWINEDTKRMAAKDFLHTDIVTILWADDRSQEDVKAAQRALGFTGKNVDGKIGNGTMDAIKKAINDTDEKLRSGADKIEKAETDFNNLIYRNNVNETLASNMHFISEEVIEGLTAVIQTVENNSEIIQGSEELTTTMKNKLTEINKFNKTKQEYIDKFNDSSHLGGYEMKQIIENGSILNKDGNLQIGDFILDTSIYSAKKFKALTTWLGNIFERQCNPYKPNLLSGTSDLRFYKGGKVMQRVNALTLINKYGIAYVNKGDNYSGLVNFINDIKEEKNMS